MPVARKLNELDYRTNEVIHTFDSVDDACRKHNINPRSIYNALVNGNGYIHKKQLRFEYVGIYEIRKVQQLDYETGEVIETYRSAQAAAEDNFVDSQRLRYALRNKDGIIHKKKLRFKYLD